MKFVVTGATGFVGTPLVAALRSAGHDVIALVRNVERAKQHLRGDEDGKPDTKARTPGTKLCARTTAQSSRRATSRVPNT